MNPASDPAKQVELPRRMLVAVDFSEPSRKALAASVALSRRFQSTLTVAHVTSRNRPDSHLAAEQAGLTFDTRRLGAEQLEDFLKRELPGGLQAGRFVADGEPFNEIVEAARVEESDLIVLATHGYTGLKHVLLGSTAERVMRHAGCAVLALRGREAHGAKTDFAPDKLQRILMPTDFSENSLRAIPQVAAWAREFKAGVIVLYVVPEHLPGEFSQIGLVVHDRRLAEQAGKVLPDLCRTRFPSDLTVECRVQIGAPDVAICRTAREADTDLIIISSHGYTGVKRVLIGSVAERVLQHAPCAVLVVKNEQASRGAGNTPT